MQKIMHRRIHWHLDTAASLDPHQTGFRPHMITHDSLLFVYNNVLPPTRTSGNPQILVAIDVKKLSIQFLVRPWSKVPAEVV